MTWHHQVNSGHCVSDAGVILCVAGEVSHRTVKMTMKPLSYCFQTALKCNIVSRQSRMQEDGTVIDFFLRYKCSFVMRKRPCCSVAAGALKESTMSFKVTEQIQFVELKCSDSLRR